MLLKKLFPGEQLSFNFWWGSAFRPLAHGGKNTRHRFKWPLQKSSFSLSNEQKKHLGIGISSVFSRQANWFIGWFRQDKTRYRSENNSDINHDGVVPVKDKYIENRFSTRIQNKSSLIEFSITYMFKLSKTYNIDRSINP